MGLARGGDKGGRKPIAGVRKTPANAPATLSESNFKPGIRMLQIGNAIELAQLGEVHTKHPRQRMKVFVLNVARLFPAVDRRARDTDGLARRVRSQPLATRRVSIT